MPKTRRRLRAALLAGSVFVGSAAMGGVAFATSSNSHAVSFFNHGHVNLSSPTQVHAWSETDGLVYQHASVDKGSTSYCSVIWWATIHTHCDHFPSDSASNYLSHHWHDPDTAAPHNQDHKMG